MRYLNKLREHMGTQNIEAISGDPPGSNHISPSRIPTSSDLLIMFVKNSLELDTLISTKQSFEGVRKVLVLAQSDQADSKKYHALVPRYITQANRDIDELMAVIGKMKANSH